MTEDTAHRTVTTQAELDAALADGVGTVTIDSPEGVWLTFDPPAGSSSRAELWGSSSAELWGSSSAVLWGSSRAVLWDSSSAELRDSSRAELRDSSRAELRDSSRAELWGSSRAELRDSSSAVLRGSSRAEAAGATSVHARGESTVNAGSLVAVHLHSARAHVTGGVVIDVTALDLADPQTWCDYHGVKVTDGVATVYKAVDDRWQAGYGYTLTSYAPGSTPEAADWRPDGYCGGGLHFGPTPGHARAYNGDATKVLAVGVRLDEVSVIDGNDTDSTAKLKAKRVVVACVEVDRFGDPVPVVAAVVSA